MKRVRQEVNSFISNITSEFETLDEGEKKRLKLLLATLLMEEAEKCVAPSVLSFHSKPAQVMTKVSTPCPGTYWRTEAMLTDPLNKHLFTERKYYKTYFLRSVCSSEYKPLYVGPKPECLRICNGCWKNLKKDEKFGLIKGQSEEEK